jgi:hypothetical protein
MRGKTIVYIQRKRGKNAQRDSAAAKPTPTCLYTRARGFIVEGDFRRLFDELDMRTLLPAVGIPLIPLGLAARDNDRQW